MKEELTLKERLLQEFSAAIVHCYGDMADTTFDIDNVTANDIDYIARKVKFYLGL